MTSDPIFNDSTIPNQIPASTERRTVQWDVKNAPKNYFSLVFAQVGAALLSFASIWLLTRHIGAEGYGTFTALLLGVQIAQITIMWTGNALSRFGVQEFVETGKITKTFWARTTILIPNLILMGALSSLWLPPIAKWLKMPPEFFPLLLFYFGVMALSMHTQAAMQGAKLIRLQSLVTFTERAIVFLILLGLSIGGNISLSAAIWAYILAPFALALFAIWRLLPFLSGFTLEISIVKKILIFSLPIPLYSVTSYLTLNHLDAVFILRYLTFADLGVYSVAYQINGLVGQLSVLAGVILMPMLVTSQTHNEGSLRTSYFQDVLPLLTFCFGIISVLIGLVGYFLLPIIFGESFTQVGALLLVFSAACAISVPIQAGFLPLVYSVSATYIQLIAAAIGAAANIAFNILLIPHFGLIGCVWATIISLALNMLVFAFLIGKKLDTPSFPTILSTLPIVCGVIVFTWSGNIVIFSVCILTCSLLLLAVNHNAFLRGYRKFRLLLLPIL